VTSGSYWLHTVCRLHSSGCRHTVCMPYGFVGSGYTDLVIDKKLLLFGFLTAFNSSIFHALPGYGCYRVHCSRAAVGKCVNGLVHL
jgi:hypothetical protein